MQLALSLVRATCCTSTKRNRASCSFFFFWHENRPVQDHTFVYFLTAIRLYLELVTRPLHGCYPEMASRQRIGGALGPLSHRLSLHVAPFRTDDPCSSVGGKNLRAISRLIHGLALPFRGQHVLAASLAIRLPLHRSRKLLADLCFPAITQLLCIKIWHYSGPLNERCKYAIRGPFKCIFLRRRLIYIACLWPLQNYQDTLMLTASTICRQQYE